MKKRLVLRIFFMLEIVVFTFIGMFGKNGRQALLKAQQKNHELLAHICELERNLTQQREKQLAWQQSSFFKEKIARENLHMARADEAVYYFS